MPLVHTLHFKIVRRLPPTQCRVITGGSVISGDTTNDTSIDLSFSFSKPTGNFEATDITVTNGTLGYLSGSGNVYGITFTPTNTGPTSINIPAGVFTYNFGNTNKQATQFD